MKGKKMNYRKRAEWKKRKERLFFPVRNAKFSTRQRWLLAEWPMHHVNENVGWAGQCRKICLVSARSLKQKVHCSPSSITRSPCCPFTESAGAIYIEAAMTMT